MCRYGSYIMFVVFLWLALAYGASPSHAAETATFGIVARDGQLHPARLEVPANTKIKLTLENAGRAPVEFENLDLRIEKVLAPGAKSFVVIHPLRPGNYRFIDEFHADTAEVMIVAK